MTSAAGVAHSANESLCVSLSLGVSLSDPHSLSGMSSATGVVYSAEEFEKLFLQGQRQKGQLAALEEENSRLKAELSFEQRARSKAVSKEGREEWRKAEGGGVVQVTSWPEILSSISERRNNI